MAVVIRNARLLTLVGAGSIRVSTHGDLGVVERGYLMTNADRITAVGSGEPPGDIAGDAIEIDANGRVVMPGFIDAHTHACFAGDRLDEWELKQRGATYLELMQAGGGIMSTVRATRAVEPERLTTLLIERLQRMLRGGTTTMEVKSGYGLTTRHELESLRAIHAASRHVAARVVATACIGHAIDPAHPGGVTGFVDEVIAETLPAVHAEFPKVPIDCYCEQGAWSFQDAKRLLAQAVQLGHPIRPHTDQFNTLGLTRWAIENGARSVDHLEATTPSDLAQVAASNTFAVMLPCAGFHTDGRYGDARTLIDAGGQLVIATNYNPGSSPCHSMPMAIALAVRHLRVTAAEAIVACTRNAAMLLDLPDVGQLRVGARADVVMLCHRDERQLGYEFGGNPVDTVICGGTPIR